MVRTYGAYLDPFNGVRIIMFNISPQLKRTGTNSLDKNLKNPLTTLALIKVIDDHTLWSITHEGMRYDGIFNQN